jgi:rRNA maturation endonuclease Nob1
MKKLFKSLNDRVEKLIEWRSRCLTCGAKWQEGNKYCGMCGGEYKAYTNWWIELLLLYYKYIGRRFK